MGNGDKPLLPDYSNVSEKHFTYGNTCLNLAWFTPRTCLLCKLNTDIQERTEVLLGLKCLPYCLCALSHLPPAGHSSTADCWRKNGEVRHSNLQLKLQRTIQTRQCSNLLWKPPGHDLKDWMLTKAPNFLSFGALVNLPFHHLYLLGGTRKNVVLQDGKGTCFPLICFSKFIFGLLVLDPREGVVNFCTSRIKIIRIIRWLCQACFFVLLCYVALREDEQGEQTKLSHIL